MSLNKLIVPYTYYALLFTFHCYSLFRANTDGNTDCAVGAHAVLMVVVVILCEYLFWLGNVRIVDWVGFLDKIRQSIPLIFIDFTF